MYIHINVDASFFHIFRSIAQSDPDVTSVADVITNSVLVSTGTGSLGRKKEVTLNLLMDGDMLGTALLRLLMASSFEFSFFYLFLISIFNIFIQFFISINFLCRGYLSENFSFQ